MFDIFVFDRYTKTKYKIFFFTSKIPKTFHNGHVQLMKCIWEGYFGGGRGGGRALSCSQSLGQSLKDFTTLK